MRFARNAGRFIYSFTAVFFIPFQGFSTGQIIIYATDSSQVTAPPPNTEVYLDTSTMIVPGTNQWVIFDSVIAGTHTVEVTTVESGYLPRQSSTDPDAVNDPDSDYGNPRNIEVLDEKIVSPSFLFDPIITVSAVVRNTWTMERLESAAIEFVFEGLSGGEISTQKYPPTASYASNWISDIDGNFPNDTILYLHDYDLSITKTGYELFTSNNVISNAVAGDHFDLGTLFLKPTDINTNQIADKWETQFFGTGSTVVVDADPDNDGMDNRSEYIAGTDPTNWYSCLWLEPISGSNSFHLAWYTEADRTYRISGTTNLCSDTWVQVGGTWEATNGQLEMFWAETNHNLSWNNNYRVEVVPCWWEGINQVLIRTNDWSTGGGGTNSGGGGFPPIP